MSLTEKHLSGSILMGKKVQANDNLSPTPSPHHKKVNYNGNNPPNAGIEVWEGGGECMSEAQTGVLHERACNWQK